MTRLSESERRSLNEEESNETTTVTEPWLETSRRVRPDVSVVDITATFTSAALGLANGILIRDDALTLFEAVSAIEIGDTKMDSGTVEAGESLDDHYDPTAPLMSEEVLWLMDELLCCEVAWHMGYPLSQTLFTSIHINKLLWPDPKTLADAQFGDQKPDDLRTGMLHVIFRSYCLALVKACDLVRSTIISQHYYEEEDFTSQLFHRELLHRFDTNQIYIELDKAESWLKATGISVQLKDAIRSRLRIRHDILRMLESCSHIFGRPQSPPFKSASMSHDIQDSTCLGKPVSAAFSVKIQRHLASSVPPKPRVVIARKPAIVFMAKWFADAYNVSELFSSQNAADMLHAYWIFMSQDPQPSVHIRSLVQSYVEDNERILGRWQLHAFVLSDMQRLVIPDISVSESLIDEEKGLSAAKVLLEFAKKTGEFYLNIFRSFCLNRCRTRRTLCHAVVDWDQLQVEAEEYDILLQGFTREQPKTYSVDTPPTYSYPLSSWVYHYKLTQMQIIAQIDFELNVYAQDEMAQMYWYIAHLSSIQLLHLDRISFFSESLLSPEPRRAPGLSQTERRDLGARVHKSLKDLFNMYTKIKGTEELARALHYLYVFLVRHNHITRQNRPYASEKLRHELRMKPFLQVSIPEPPSSDELEEQALLAFLTDDELLAEAGRAGAASRRAWEEILRNPKTEETKNQMSTSTFFINEEWTRDVKNTIRSAIAVGIATSTLETKLKAGLIQNISVQIPISVQNGLWHPRWVVPKIG